EAEVAALPEQRPDATVVWSRVIANGDFDRAGKAFQFAQELMVRREAVPLLVLGGDRHQVMQDGHAMLTTHRRFQDGGVRSVLALGLKRPGGLDAEPATLRCIEHSR